MTKFENWSIATRVSALSAVLIAIACATSLVCVISTRKLLGNLNGIATVSVPNVQQITAIQALGLEFRGTSLLMGTPGLSVGYKTKQLAHLKELRSEILQRVQKYGGVVSLEERPTYQHLQTATGTFVKTLDHFLDLSLSGHSVQAGAFWSSVGGAISKAFRKALEDEVTVNERLNEQHLESGLSAGRLATRLSWSLLLLSALLGVALTLLIVRGITRALNAAVHNLRRAAEQVASASNEVAAASYDLAEKSSTQAASLEQTSAAGEDVTRTARRNAANCQTAATLMQETATVVAEANRRLDGTLTSMAEITASSERIAKVIKVIDEIAFQTNILALNAAVEAARAGQYGAGFAVVADEVRSLAARCARAAEEIANSIGESVTNASTGKIRLDQAAESVHNLGASALKVKELVGQVDTDAQGQTACIDQIAQALLQIEQTTQHTAAMAEQSASASAELKAQASAMEDVVGLLEALI